MEVSENCTANPDRRGYLLLLPIPILAGIVNLVVILAATLYRKKLQRHSYVYISVASTLLSNILFICDQLWEDIAHYRITDEAVMKKPQGRLGYLWTLCTSAWIALLSAVCGNLTVLTYVLIDSTSFQKSLRHPVNATSNCKTKCVIKKELAMKRRRALLLLAFTWLLPLVLTITAVMAWHCVDHCSCSLSAQGEVCSQSFGCSRVWPPMKNSFMGTNAGIWLIEVVVLVSVNVTKIKKIYKPSPPTTNGGRSLPLSSFKNKLSVNSNGADRTSFTDSAKVGSDDVFRPNRGSALDSMNPRLKLVVSLSSLFIVSTIMIPITFLVDVFSVSSFPVLGLRFVSTALLSVHTLACPLLLVRFLSPLKNALIRMGTAKRRRCKQQVG